jgi:hypothetical protein
LHDDDADVEGTHDDDEVIGPVFYQVVDGPALQL